MDIKQGPGTTPHGPGVSIHLTGEELWKAIHAFLVAHGAYIEGPSTTYVNGELIQGARINVDPSGLVVHKDHEYNGRNFETPEDARPFKCYMEYMEEERCGDICPVCKVFDDKKKPSGK